MSDRILYIVDGLIVIASAVLALKYIFTANKDSDKRTKAFQEHNVLTLRSKAISSNDEMVDHLLHIGVIRRSDVAAAMRMIDRKNFVLPECENPYKDESQPIGFNATLSAPHMHGVGLDILAEVLPKSNARILDIGSGSGYMCACFAKLAGPTGKVFGVEHVKELVEASKVNIAKCDPNLLDQIQIKHGDGFEGWEENGPYDCIYFGAAAPEVPPKVLAQLKPGGRMLLPIGGRTEFHTLTQVDANEDGSKAVVKSLGSVRFTPLTDLADQLSGTHRGGRSYIADTGEGKHAIVLPHVVPAPDASPQELEILRSVSTQAKYTGTTNAM